jgi:hypothetical protein
LFYTLPVWVAYHGRFEEAKAAETIVAELISIRHGCYFWEGGLNLALLGNAVVGRGPPIDEDVQLSLARHLAPRYVETAKYNMAYIDEVEKLRKEEMYGDLGREGDKLAAKEAKAEDQVYKSADKLAKLVKKTVGEYEKLYDTSTWNVDAWRTRAAEAGEKLNAAKAENAKTRAQIEAMRAALKEAQEKKSVEGLSED